MNTNERFAHLDDFTRNLVLAREARTGYRGIPCPDLVVGSTVYMLQNDRCPGTVVDVRASTKRERNDGHADIVAVIRTTEITDTEGVHHTYDEPIDSVVSGSMYVRI